MRTNSNSYKITFMPKIKNKPNYWGYNKCQIIVRKYYLKIGKKSKYCSIIENITHEVFEFNGNCKNPRTNWYKF